MQTIKSAAEHLADIERQRTAEAQRRRYAETHPSHDQRIAIGEALRDDVMSHVPNAGISFERLHALSGVAVVTLAKWANRETRFPQIATAQAILRALGKTLAVVPRQ